MDLFYVAVVTCSHPDCAKKAECRISSIYSNDGARGEAKRQFQCDGWHFFKDDAYCLIHDPQTKATGGPS